MASPLQDRLATLAKEIIDLRQALRIEEAVGRLHEVEAEMAKPGFWNDQDKAQQYVRELKDLKARTAPVLELEKGRDEAAELLEIAEEEDDADTLAEIEAEVAALEERGRVVSVRAYFRRKEDLSNAFLSIQAGAGGTDASDWADLLLRMYSRWAERAGYDIELVDKNPHEEAGIRSATIRVKGPYAYGQLTSEIGVHRLVRISPFDASNRRQTSFAAVDVVPEVDDDINVEINDSDLRVDTYRSSGAGGQHVNVTDSAVRITHLPTGVVVQCQRERSQHANRRVAMALLRAKLHQIERQKRDDELSRLYGEKGEIAWGNQIRSYVMQPYQLVKDTRTGVETGNVQAVLDGDLDAFMEAYLRRDQA